MIPFYGIIEVDPVRSNAPPESGLEPKEPGFRAPIKLILWEEFKDV